MTRNARLALYLTLVCIFAGPGQIHGEVASSYTHMPPFLTNAVTPLVMLVMGRDHTLYYDAYNDALDINGDGVLDTKYNPNIDYYGYFDSYKYYEYVTDTFVPRGYTASDKKAPSGNYWSGNFLNYMTMSRLDVVRKVLYGGFRRVDTSTETILERAYIPNDAHCWGKEYKSIANDGYDISEFTPLSVPTSGRHLFASGSVEAYTSTSNKTLFRIKLNSAKRVSAWVSTESGISGGIMGSSTDLVGTPDYDFQVRVKVGVSTLPDFKSEKLYTATSGSTVYKPIGILQRYGESNRILFGLLTGSYKNHLSGGVLRKNIGTITDEISSQTGQFLYKTNSTLGGIVKSIDNFNVYGFNVSTNYWDQTVYSRPINQGENYMWGNPVGEMMYESLRYFSGVASTPSFTSSVSSGNDLGFNIPLEAWKDPYKSTAAGGLGYPLCSKPFILVLSDINPSYDTNQLPGVYSGFDTGFSGTFSANSTSFNAASLADTIFSHESLSGAFYIGQSATDYDNSCSEKNISGFGNIRGLCPEEPTKLGGYYSAASAFYGKQNDINTATEVQTVTSYAVALASPLPRIEIPMGSNFITLVPFSKTVYSTAGGGVSPTGAFQPTCAIVDFYVEELNATDGKFIVSFEHAEQGSDFDMDGLVQYEYTKTSNSTVVIKVSNINIVEGGGSKQHFGYIISGTTKDGTYLEVKNKFHLAADDPDYYLDTPPGVWPGQSGTPWDDNVALPNNATRTFTASSATGATLLNNPLWYAAKWGGFEDKNNNNLPDRQDEWDKDWDGVPDTYFYVANPAKLEEQLEKSFADILRRTASGTATSTHHQTRDGEGARYRAIFFPEIKDTSGNTISWAGHLHSLLMDKKGNIREDTNKNGQLDSTDRFIVYDDTTIYRYRDLNGDLLLSASEKNSTAEVLTSQLAINYLWSATDWLNSISNAEVVTQRSAYNATTNNRYILTFADKNDNMIVEAGEVQNFAWPPASASAGLTGSTDYYAYLTLFPSFEDTPTVLNALRSSDMNGFKTLVEGLAERQVDFIRGEDKGAATISGYSLNATRNRVYVEGGQQKTWRLGDIVYSTPTVIGKPAEQYNLTYKDLSYNSFVNKYANRRHVVYVGSNDGMIHAFNAGFFNSTRTGFDLTRSGEVSFPLGMEVWAYIPYNILPHLLWLTESDYSGQTHIPYMDLKPRIFDARIFFQPDNVTPLDSDHPGGWGTVLVSGMRLGGGKIRADLDKTDGMAFNATRDRAMSSAYVVMDITNPEKPPRPMGELRLPYQGFTTCYPAVMPMSTPNANATDGSDNNWFLVFGSGPADGGGNATSTVLATAASLQSGKVFVLDLKALAAPSPSISTLASNGHFTAGSHVFATTENPSFIADPIAVDLDLGSSNASGKMKTDLVYYGTAAGDHIDHTGTMRRIVTANENPTGGFVTWTGNATLMNTQGAVTVAPTPALDEAKRLWLYFGTGRFFTRSDIAQVRNTSFFGVKEPQAVNAFGQKYYTWGQINLGDLYNSTNVTVSNATCGSTFTRSCVTVNTPQGDMTWDTFEKMVNNATGSGWRLDMSTAWERVIQQAVAFAGLVAWPSYVPSQDLCSFEGESWAWAVYYKTGTAYFKPIFGNGDFSIKKSLGEGVASSPGLHIGEDPKTIKMEFQMSDGSIVQIEVEPPFPFKSHPLYWIKREES